MNLHREPLLDVEPREYQTDSVRFIRIRACPVQEMGSDPKEKRCQEPFLHLGPQHTRGQGLFVKKVPDTFFGSGGEAVYVAGVARGGIDEADAHAQGEAWRAIAAVPYDDAA